MAYADKQGLSGSKIASIAIVILIHAVLGYAFVTGLAFNVIKKVATDLKTFDVEEEPPPPEEEPPPPPPDQKIEPPPVVAPPPIVNTPQIQAPVIQTVQTPPPVFVPDPRPAPPPPPPPPAPRISKAAGARGDPAQWVTQDDYPPRALREEREGTTAVSWEINEQGRVENCRVTSSSGSPDLDEAACRALTRRGRYQPALDQDGNPIRSTQSRRIRWTIPKG